MRLIKDGEKGGRGYGRGGRGRVYSYRYTVTTRMTSALRWAAMRAILMFHNCEGQSHKTASTDHNFWRERRAEADSNWGPSAYQPNALPLGQTGSLMQLWWKSFISTNCITCKPRNNKKILGSVAVISHHYAHDVHVNQAILPPFC